MVRGESRRTHALLVLNSAVVAREPSSFCIIKSISMRPLEVVRSNLSDTVNVPVMAALLVENSESSNRTD